MANTQQLDIPETPIFELFSMGTSAWYCGQNSQELPAVVDVCLNHRKGTAACLRLFRMNGGESGQQDVRYLNWFRERGVSFRGAPTEDLQL